MAVITRTERTNEDAGLGISNPIVVYSAASQLLDWSPATILVYLKLNSLSVGALLISRELSSSINGLRFNISSTSGNHWFSARSSSGNFPVKYANSPMTVGEWRHIAAVWNGSHLASGITLYHADDGDSISDSGSGSATDGSATNLYPFGENAARGLRLYNSGVSDAPAWPARADIAYIAVWKRALTQAELETARSSGPLNVHPTDLVLLRANGVDLSGYDATTSTEPAFPDGSLPPILALGGSLTVSAISRSVEPSSIALPNQSLVIAPLTRETVPASVTLQTIAIHGDFERSSINPTLSSVGVSDISGDEAGTPLVVLSQRLQTVTTMGTNRWLEPFAKLTGVNGLRPRIEIVPYNISSGDNRNHQTWYAAQRAHYSYDGETWTPIASKTFATRLTWRHESAFAADTVYVARSWPYSVTQVGARIAALAAMHATKIAPAPSAVSYSPTNPEGFPAPDCMVQEVAAKTDEISRAVPVTPLYGFVIDDSAYGAKSKTAVITMGIHAGEDLGELVGWEMIDYLLGSSASAVALRQTTRILVYPLANPAGRWAGYWRGAPGSDADPNREWNLSTPTHDCVTKLKEVILADVASYGSPVAWAFDIHSSPGGDGILQLGVNEAYPESVEFDALVRAKYPAGMWADYSDRTSTPVDPSASGTLTAFFRRELAAALVMLNESSDIYGPLSPSVMQPYAQAQVGALADMDAAGDFSPFAGDAVASVTASGELAVAIPIAAAALVSATASASLTTAVQLAAQALAGGQAVGSLSTAIQLDGAAVSAVVSAGELTAQIRLDGAALAAALASGALSTGDGLEGAAAGSALASGSLTTLIVLQGAAVGAALAAADLSTVPSGLAGDATAGAAAAGALTTAIPLLGGAQVSVIAAGTVATTVSLAGAAVAVVAVSGDLVVALELSADAVAAAVAGADLTTQIVMRADAVAGAQASGALGGIALLAPPPSYRIVRARAENRTLRAR